MQAFVDLQGASGSSFRFRLAPDGVVATPIAGNYAIVREETEGFTVLAVEATNDLSSATEAWRRAVAKQGAAHLFTRLNVAVALRENEREDIAAYYLSPTRPNGSPSETNSSAPS